MTVRIGFLRVILCMAVSSMALAAEPAGPQDWSQWRELSHIRVGKSHLTIADLSMDEQLILAMSEMEGTVRIHEKLTEKLLRNLPIAQYKQFESIDVTFWPEASGEPRFIVAVNEGLFLYSAANGEMIKPLSTTGAGRMRWSPDRRILVCSRSNFGVQQSSLTFYKIVPPDSLEKVREIEFPNRVDDWDLDLANRHIAVTFYPNYSLEYIDLESSKTLWSAPVPEYANSVDISPDGAMIAVGGESLVLLDARDPTRKSSYAAFNNNIHMVRFSPTGEAIAAAAYDGHVRIFPADLATPELPLLADLRHAGTSNVYAIIFYANGSRLLSTSGDQTIRFWGEKVPPAAGR